MQTSAQRQILKVLVSPLYKRESVASISKSTIGWTKMHEVFKSLLPRYFLKDIYVK